MDGMKDPLYKLALSWGGVQLKRIIEANQALNEGEVMVGKVRIRVSDNLLNRVLGNLFGKYSMPEVREYFKNRQEKTQENYMRKHG